MSSEPDRDIMAYVDGQLRGEALDAFLARLSDSPDLRREVEDQADLHDRLRAAYGPGPRPEESAFLLPLLTAPQAGPAVQRGGARTWTRPHWWAMAASLLLGLGISQMLPLFHPTALVRERQGALIAQGDLFASLEHRPEREQAGSPIALPVSFRSAQGYCRVFAVKDGLSGIACRRDGLWQVETAVGGASGAQAGGAYRQAGSDVPPSVMAQVDERISGDPMSEQEVRAALAKGWAR